MKLKQIKIPEEFRRHPVRRYKVEYAKNYLLQYKELDKPILVNRYGFCIDQFSRWKAMRELGLGEEDLIFVAEDYNGNKLYTYKF